MKGKLIVLNGSSSSGKTSIATYLKEILPSDFLILGIDVFMRSMSSSFAAVEDNPNMKEDYRYGFKFIYNNLGKLNSIHLSDYGYNYISTVYRSIGVFLDSGLNVVFDDMIFNDKIYHIFKTTLSEYNYKFIKINCNESIRKNREQDRGDRIHGTYLIGNEFIDKGIVYDYEFTNESQNIEFIAKIIAENIKLL